MIHNAQSQCLTFQCGISCYTALLGRYKNYDCKPYSALSHTEEQVIHLNKHFTANLLHKPIQLLPQSSFV